MWICLLREVQASEGPPRPTTTTSIVETTMGRAVRTILVISIAMCAKYSLKTTLMVSCRPILMNKWRTVHNNSVKQWIWSAVQQQLLRTLAEMVTTLQEFISKIALSKKKKKVLSLSLTANNDRTTCVATDSTNSSNSETQLKDQLLMIQTEMTMMMMKCQIITILALVCQHLLHLYSLRLNCNSNRLQVRDHNSSSSVRGLAILVCTISYTRTRIRLMLLVAVQTTFLWREALDLLYQLIEYGITLSVLPCSIKTKKSKRSATATSAVNLKMNQASKSTIARAINWSYLNHLNWSKELTKKKEKCLRQEEQEARTKEEIPFTSIMVPETIQVETDRV